MSKTILDEIVEHKHSEVAERSLLIPVDVLIEQIDGSVPPRGFTRAGECFSQSSVMHRILLKSLAEGHLHGLPFFRLSLYSGDILHSMSYIGSTIPDSPKGCAAGQAAYAAQRESLC